MTLPVDGVKEQLPVTAKVSLDLPYLWVTAHLTLSPWITPETLYRSLLMLQEFRLP